MTVFCRNKFVSLGSTSQDSTFAEWPNRKKDSEEKNLSLTFKLKAVHETTTSF